MSTQEDANQRRRDRENDYWRKVSKTDRFDVGKIPVPYGMNGLMQIDCESNNVPFRTLVTLYAKLGLHRYNMWQSKNLQLSGLKKFNMEMGAQASPYWITLDAKDPATSLNQTFQVLVTEEGIGILDLRCYIARPEEISNEEPYVDWNHEMVHCFSLPDLLPLPLNAFNDENRFYIVKKSELRDHDWIRLYLELAVCTENRMLEHEDLCKLEIVGVAIETEKEDMEPPYMRLIAKKANVYIRFKDLLGKDRLAIVRRIIDETTGYLTLKGDILSEDDKASCLSLRNAEKASSSSTNKRRSVMFLLRRRLGVHRPWRLSSPRHHVYKKHGLRRFI